MKLALIRNAFAARPRSCFTLEFTARIFGYIIRGTEACPVSSAKEKHALELVSQKKNTRFKPFRRAMRRSAQDREMQTFKTFFAADSSGPVTNYIDFCVPKWVPTFGGGGLATGYLWNVALTHVISPNPYTRQSLFYARSFDDFHRGNPGRRWGYEISIKFLGPRLHRGCLHLPLERRRICKNSGDDFASRP